MWQDNFEHCGGFYGVAGHSGGIEVVSLNSSVLLPNRQSGESIILRWYYHLPPTSGGFSSDLKVYIKGSSSSWQLVKTIHPSNPISQGIKGEININGFSDQRIYIKFEVIPDSNGVSSGGVTDFALILRT